MISPIVFGNPEAKTKITIITNPTCNPCIEIHRKVFRLLGARNNLVISEIFLVPNNRADASYNIAEFMLKLYELESPDNIKQAFADYYFMDLKKIGSWRKQHTNPEMEKISKADTLESHLEWCFKQGFHSTPVILINNRSLPEGYNVDDLEYLID
jgi:hypothetical protein